MPDWLIYALCIFVAGIAVVNVMSIYQGRELARFLSSVGTPVAKDYFNPFGEKAGSTIQYGKAAVSGFTSVSDEGVYLESVFKFYVVVPWSNIYAIRIVDTRKGTIANLRISHNSEINREILVSWNHEFDKTIPDTVTVVNG